MNQPIVLPSTTGTITFAEANDDRFYQLLEMFTRSADTQFKRAHEPEWIDRDLFNTNGHYRDDVLDICSLIGEILALDPNPGPVGYNTREHTETMDAIVGTAELIMLRMKTDVTAECKKAAQWDLSVLLSKFVCFAWNTLSLRPHGNRSADLDKLSGCFSSITHFLDAHTELFAPPESDDFDDELRDFRDAVMSVLHLVYDEDPMTGGESGWNTLERAACLAQSVHARIHATMSNGD